MKDTQRSDTIVVIFGITGDLAQTKLLPALAEITRNKQLPDNFKLVGISRRQVGPEEVLPHSCRILADMLEVVRMDVDEVEDYKKLKPKLKGGRVIFYFAVPPSASQAIIGRLGQAGLNSARYKLLLEKPFGVDHASAKELIKQTDRYFKEEQVYRIDHYLAKEMAQNIAVFLGGNVLFRGVWSNQFIDKIEIIASESIDISGRESFYEQTGALRDLVQSHLLQLAALVLMKPCPDVFDFSELPRRRLEALTLLKPANPAKAVRGQYIGYHSDVHNPKSVTETFAALELESKDPNWQGVPLSLMTGKALDRKVTEIRVYFKRRQVKEANKLTMRIQPHEGIELDLWVKRPGYEHAIQKLPLDFNYDQYFGTHLPEAYEQVLVEAMRDRQNLFASSDEILASWKVLEPILKNWRAGERGLRFYKKGSSIKQVLSEGIINSNV